MKMLSGKRWGFVFLLCGAALGVFSSSSWMLSVYSDYFPLQNASLCACDKCLMEYEPWFTKLMNASPEPLLTAENKISEDTFKWWTKIQTDRRNFTVYNKTVDKVFQMFPHTPHFTEASPDRCRTCAVVGNSGNLNGSRYGPLIDFHDIVIRINRGPTKDFERDVGTKTTHRVMYPSSSSHLDNTTHLVLFPYKIWDLQWLTRMFPQNPNANPGLKANKDLVMILSPAFMKYVHHVWLKEKGLYPSTGFLTLILSMHMCDEVSVFGFGADRNGDWGHYFEDVNYKYKYKNVRTGQHAGHLEFNTILELCQRQKITFYKGW